MGLTSGEYINKDKIIKWYKTLMYVLDGYDAMKGDRDKISP